jgi:ADP-ribose pyrophosphatase YjhB (NUDIX family)
MAEPAWLTIARELQAIGQIGLAYTKEVFDKERYERVLTLAASLMSCGSGVELEPVLDLFRQDTGYATPKVDVRGAAFVEDGILMVRERSDGLWTLPGGWADVNAAPAECVVREIAEESGFEARAVKLAAVWDYRKQGHVSRHPASIYKMFFICEITGGSARPGVETSEVGFFARDALPALSPGRITEAQIHRMFAHRDGEQLASEFD